MTHSTTHASTTRDNWDQHWHDYAEIAEHNPAQRYRRQVACKLLDRYGCSDAARILDIDRTTLYNKLRRYGLR